MKLLSRLEKAKSFWTFFGLCAFFFLLRFPSLFEPNWYGDEGIYQVIGRGLVAGRLLYRDIWDNKPPLLYVFYALVNGNQFAIRLVSLFFGLVAIFIFMQLAKKIFRLPRIVFVVTLVFTVFLGLPVIEGNIANAENFLIVPSLAAGYLFYTLADEKTKYKRHYLLLFTAGLFSGLSLAFKVFGLFDFLAFFSFYLFTKHTFSKKKELRVFLEETLSICAGVFLPLVISGIYFAFQHAFSYFFDSVLKGNISYVGVNNELLIPQGLLLLKAGLLFLGVGILFVKRKLFQKQELFLLLWIVFSLFSAFFSQRDYPHYQLVVLPVLALGIGLVFQSNQLRQLIALGLLTVALLLVYFNFEHWTFTRTLAYYDNFFQFAQGKETVTMYQSFFDPHTPRDYALADFLRLHTKPNQTTFVWGDNPEVYVLSGTMPPGRYAVAYHILTDKDTLAETAIALRTKTPGYIIIMPDLPSIPFTMHDYIYRGMIDGAQIYEYSL